MSNYASNRSFLLYIDVHIFDSNLVKNAFTRCRVPFRSFCVFQCLEYHRTAVSKVSKGKKWSVNCFQTLKVQEVEYTYSSKKIWVSAKFVLLWCSEMNIGETCSFSLPGTWLKVSSTKKNSAKKLICIGEKSVPQTACLLSKSTRNLCIAEPREARGGGERGGHKMSGMEGGENWSKCTCVI